MPRNLETNPELCNEQQKIQLASFWFADCYYMRGVNNSNDMTVNLAKLHEEHPDIFDFKHAMSMKPEEIDELLLEYHLPVQHKQISGAWVENARRMVEQYDGDPRALFENFGTYETLVKCIANDFKGNGFIGFQKKMTSMLGYYYMSIGLIPYQNIPLPVDFHVMRMAISQELITFEGMDSQVVPFDKTTELIRGITYDFAERHSVSQLDLCDVVWSYSREACVQSPTNSQKIVGERKGRRTVWEPALLSAADASHGQLDAYQQACGICRLKDTCAHNVPSGRYYVSGEIWWPDPKIHLDHPQDDLHHDNTIQMAQQPVLSPESNHAIDLRDLSREEAAKRRAVIIRQLAQQALFGPTQKDVDQITAALATTNNTPTTSLASKKFAFSLAEITAALGHKPDQHELEAIGPYRATS